jgi:hypothetical protein
MVKKIELIGLLAVTAGVVGCQPQPAGTVAPLSDAIVRTDAAMVRRDWPGSRAEYANGQVVADPTYVRYEPRHDLEPWKYYFVDTGSFLANVFLLPVGLFQTPADADVTYPGYVVPESHYGVPPLPPSITPNRPEIAKEIEEAGPATVPSQPREVRDPAMQPTPATTRALTPATTQPMP